MPLLLQAAQLDPEAAAAAGRLQDAPLLLTAAAEQPSWTRCLFSCRSLALAYRPTTSSSSSSSSRYHCRHNPPAHLQLGSSTNWRSNGWLQHLQQQQQQQQHSQAALQGATLAADVLGVSWQLKQLW
jgi:hypothetical protein